MNTSLKALLTTVALAALSLTAPRGAWAQEKPIQPVAGADDMADAEVRKVDLDGGKITLKHGEIKSLDMPPMTMVFVVKDRSVLERLKPGDKVKFKAINEAGKYTVTEIQPVK